jgi:hypothetical protein
MSSNHKIKKCSETDCNNTTTKTWCKSCGYKNRTVNIWNKGIEWSDEIKEKISKSKKGVKNPKHSDWLKKNPNLYWLGKKRPELSQEKNAQWKGGDVGYRGLHIWVNNMLGKPDTCEHCGKSGLIGQRIHWANKSHQYKREISDWLRLCASCHKEYDKNV